jgi:putative lipoprotein
MRKHRLFSLGVLAAFFAASIFITACGGLNDPQKPQNPANQDNTKPAAQQMVAADVFPKAPDGTTYSGYKITWTDAQGKEQTKTVTVDDIKNGIVLTGGVKEGTKPKVTPLVKNADGTETEKPDATQEVNPSSSTDWKLYIKAGIDELSREKPDYDAALAWFKDAYGAEKNNTTKAYYAVVQLASISVKQETVDFMQNKMGFATYPKKLNALVNLDWFKEQTYKTRSWTNACTYLFLEKTDGYYYRVSGHIASSPDTAKVSIRLSQNRDIYERGTFAGLNGKWGELGYDEAWKKIDSMPIADRKRWYDYNGPDQLPHTGEYFIVDSFDENGNYMVWNSPYIESMQGAAVAKRYDREIEGNISYYYDAQGSLYAPELKPAADWYKELNPLLQIPAYIIEHSDSTNVDQLIDELYGILFGKEFTNASTVLNSLDATKSVTIDKQLIKRLGMSGEDRIFPEDTDVELQKEQLLGLIGSMTVAKGAFELVQSYSFNTDLNILKWNWEKEDEILKNLGSYKQSQDPFNNGFMKGRSSSKMADAKADIVKGADLLLAAYKSLTDSETLPSEVKAKVKEYTDFVQVIVQEIRDAVAEGRKANILIGENNPLAKPPVYPEPLPGEPHPAPVYLTKFEIDMGKVFTYEYFKLSNLFEMDGSKPKIYDANGSVPYMNLTLKRFMDDFVTVKFNNNSEIFVDFGIPLNNDAGKKIINFYK